MSGVGSRWRPTLLVGVAAIIASASFWLLQTMRGSGPASAPTAARSAPDYYIDNFHFIRMTDNGQPHYSLSGAKLTHFPLDNSSEIDLPLLHRLEKNQAPMMIRADRARSEDHDSKIHMRGHVNVERPATAMAKYFHLDSDYLLVLPDEDVVQTDQAVHIVHDRTTLDGVGMYANNATLEFRLANRVHGTFPATRP